MILVTLFLTQKLRPPSVIRFAKTISLVVTGNLRVGWHIEIQLVTDH